MKHIAYFLIGSFLLFPNLSLAIETSGQCSQDGYTIATINGVFTDDTGAKQNMRALKDKVGDIYNNQIIDYQYLLNPTHLGGIGDFVMAAYQKFFDESTVSDYDLVEMIKTASEKVSTQKLLLVAHSQGNFYANSFYDAVTRQSGGVPAQSIGVYSVATPAGRVAGGGKWLTSDTDKVIADLVALAPFKKIKEPNTSIARQNKDSWLMHDFSNIYLKYKSDRIVSDIYSSLDQLQSDIVRDMQKPCINPSHPTVVHQAAGMALAAGDFVVQYVVVSPVAVAQTIGTYIGNTTVAIAGMIKNTGSSLWTFLSNVPTHFLSAQLSGLIGANEQPAPTSQPTPLPPTAPQPLLQPISVQPVAVPQPQPEAEAPIIINPIAYEAPSVPTTETPSVQESAPQAPAQQLFLTSDVGNTEIEAPAPVYHGSAYVSGVSLDVVIVPPAEELPVLLSFSETSATTDATATSTDSTATSTEEVIVTATSTEPVIVAEPEIIDGAPVVINEIAWMGTKAQANDEWIELYNKTSADIDLSGWTLESRNKQLSISLSGTISAQGYFLLERTASTTTDQLENMVYTGALNNSGPDANIYLKNGTTTIDAVDFGSWPHGNNGEKRTMERVSPYATSTNSYNWKTYSEAFTAPFAKDAKDGDILGTPGAKNSVTGYYVPAWHVIEDTVWRKKYSPYYVPPYMLEVRNGAILTIEPGVVVKFAKGMSSYGGGMDVHGVVRAEGTTGEPIIFTSFLDDAVDGVDSNQDGSATLPAPADWMNVNFYGTTTPSVIAHAQVRYGGQGRNNNPNGWYPTHTGVFGVYGANPQITDSLFEQNYATSLYMKNGAHPRLTRNTIKNTVFHTQASAWMSGFGMRIADASSTADIIENVFEDNTVGISSESATSTPLIVRDNIFTRNGKNGEFNSSYGDLNLENTNNQDSEHKGGFYIYLVARDGQTKTLRADTIPYILRNGITITEGGTLAIEQGVVIKNALPVPMVVRGTLKAQGTEGKPIVFTAFTDDSDGYDSDNSAGTPASGAWKNIQFIGATSSDSILEYVTIRYGGSGENLCPYAYFGGPCMGYKGALLIQDASPTIAHVTFDKNLAIAAYVEGDARPIIEYSDFRDTKQAIKNPRETIGGIGISIGAQSTPVFTDNTFTNNNEDVVYRP